MKEFIRKLTFWLVDIINLPYIIDEVRYKKKIKHINESITNNGAYFHKESKVENNQNSSKITVGMGTHIRGQLLLFKYGGEITIGENCYVGESSRIWSAKSIEIGNNVLISHNVNIMDSDSHEIDAFERSSRYKELVEKGLWNEQGNIISSKILIEDYVWVNFNTVILKGVTIGEGAIIGANSVVTKNVKQYTFVAGNPAKFIRNL